MIFSEYRLPLFGIMLQCRPRGEAKPPISVEFIRRGAGAPTAVSSSTSLDPLGPSQQKPPPNPAYTDLRGGISRRTSRPERSAFRSRSGF
jgi:hypothetical protein